MADYAIRLNLGGNAVAKAEALSVALATADANAKSLVLTMPGLANSVNGMNAKTLAGVRSLSAAQIKAVAAYEASVIKAQASASAISKKAEADTEKRRAGIKRETAAYRERNRAATGSGRVRNNDFARMGWSQNIGGFSFGLNRILQPDANGNIMGINANRLMMGGSVVAMATSVAKNVLKTSLWATAMPAIVGGGGLMLGIRALQSEGMTRGVQLIARRRQARQGLGEALYEQAQTNADALAASYGFDRSTMLSAINVLTGSAIGGNSKNRMNIGQATSLAKVGGLIAQQNGAPIEKVLTNIQQIFTQSVPNLRDIRELLMQAPLLQKFAVADMESRGIQGVDVRDYLKDPGAVARTFARYELTNASNAGMRARGQIELARQNAWAEIAGNDAGWSKIGELGSSFLSSLGAAGNALLTAIAESDKFATFVGTLTGTLEQLTTKVDSFFDGMISLVDGASSILGIGRGSAKQRAAMNLTIRQGWENALTSVELRNSMFTRWSEKLGLPGESPALAQERFARWMDENSGALFKASSSATIPYAPYIRPEALNMGWFERITGQERLIAGIGNREAFDKASAYGIPKPNGNELTWRSPQARGALGAPTHGAFGTQTNPDVILQAFTDMLNVAANMSGDLTKIAGSGSTDSTQAGADLTGMNRDRRSLVINFNDKIAEVNNYVNGGSTSDIVRQIETNNEEAIGRAIQVALLGATGKMNARF